MAYILRYTIKGKDTVTVPEKVRIRLTRYLPVPKAGDRTEVLAMLRPPPPPPVLPGGFYFDWVKIVRELL